MSAPLHPAARGLITLLARRAFHKEMQRAAEASHADADRGIESAPMPKPEPVDVEA